MTFQVFLPWAPEVFFSRVRLDASVSAADVTPATAMPDRDRKPCMWIEDMQKLTETITGNSQLASGHARVLRYGKKTVT